MKKNEEKINSKIKEEKIDQHDFFTAWSMGMNDYEIAKKLGVSPSTIKKVKADLLKKNEN